MRRWVLNRARSMAQQGYSPGEILAEPFTDELKEELKNWEITVEKDGKKVKMKLK